MSLFGLQFKTLLFCCWRILPAILSFTIITVIIKENLRLLREIIKRQELMIFACMIFV